MNNALCLKDWTVSFVNEDSGTIREVIARYDLYTEHCPKCGVVGKLYRHGLAVKDVSDSADSRQVGGELVAAEGFGAGDIDKALDVFIDRLNRDFKASEALGITVAFCRDRLDPASKSRVICFEFANYDGSAIILRGYAASPNAYGENAT